MGDGMKDVENAVIIEDDGNGVPEQLPLFTDLDLGEMDIVVMNRGYEVTITRYIKANGSIDIKSKYEEISIHGNEELFRERNVSYSSIMKTGKYIIDGVSGIDVEVLITEKLVCYVIARDILDAMNKIVFIMMDYSARYHSKK